jgi:hypothetical protein
MTSGQHFALSGAQLRDVAKTTVYVATRRREDLDTAWDVVRDHFGDPTRLARSLAWQYSVTKISWSK